MEKQKKDTNLFSRIIKKAEDMKYTLGLFIFFTPMVITGIKGLIPYIKFVGKGPELVSSVQALEQGLLVTTSALSADMENIDSCLYKIDWCNHIYTGILKRSKSGNNYVFVRDGKLGVQVFGVYYDYDNFIWYFYDFKGKRINLNKNGRRQ